MKQMGISHNDIIRADSAEGQKLAELKERVLLSFQAKSPDYKSCSTMATFKHLHLIKEHKPHQGNSIVVWDRDKHREPIAEACRW